MIFIVGLLNCLELHLVADVHLHLHNGLVMGSHFTHLDR